MLTTVAPPPWFLHVWSWGSPFGCSTGITRAAIPWLTRRGVRAITVGENSQCAPMAVPPIFLWRDNATNQVSCYAQSSPTPPHLSLHPLFARFFTLFARTLAYACILCAWILGNILVGQWGNVGRYLNCFGVLSKDFPPGPHFPPRYIEISLRDLP